MKNKKIIIIILIIISILLIGGGTIYTIYSQKTPDKEEKETKKPDPNDPETYKIHELKSIQTPDKKIRLGTARVYSQNGITGMMLNVVPYEDFTEVYLKITLKLAKSSEDVVICLENLKNTVQVEYEVQTLNDWSTLKSWSAEIISKDEATKIWESQGIQKVN